MRKTNIFAALMLAAMTSLGASAQHQFAVQANKPGVEIQPTMYGIFFEDINFGADGGLYAEMVENRSFEFPQRLMGCTPSSSERQADQDSCRTGQLKQ